MTCGPDERGQPDRRPHVVAEHEEGAADGQDAAVLRQAVHDRAHAVLADAVVDLAPARGVGRLGLGVLELDAGVAGQVGGARHQPGDARR